MLTKDEMRELKGVVRRTMEEEMEMYEEVWLTGEELAKVCGVFTKAWLNRYGHSLPRRMPKVTDEGGVKRGNKWVYPKHQILRMIQNGEVEDLKCRAVVI